MNGTIAQSQIERAVEIISAAERDLGKLSDGQRRDLLMDNTDWSSDVIRAIVLRAEVPWVPGCLGTW